MALIRQDWTGVQTDKVTRPGILSRWLSETGWGQTGTTTAAGSTTTLVDATRLLSAQFSNREWIGGWVRFIDGDLAGTIVSITGYTPATGTITFPTQSAAPGSAVRYELWRTPVPPSLFLNALDTLMKRDVWLPTMCFLTELPDGDMEQVGTAYWTAADATLAKVTSGRGIFGKQAMTVATTAAGGYAAVTLGVTPGTSLYVGAVFTPADVSVVNTGFISIYDITNSVELRRLTTSAKVPMLVIDEVTIPSTTARLRVALGSEENGVTGIWDECIVIDPLSADVALPSWVSSVAQVRGIHRWEPVQVGRADYEYAPEFRGMENANFDYVVDRFQDGIVRAALRQGVLSRPHWMLGVRNETAFASDSEEKFVSEAWAVAGLAATGYDIVISRAGHTDTGPMIERKNYWQGEWRREKQRVSTRTREVRPGRTAWVSSR